MSLAREILTIWRYFRPDPRAVRRLEPGAVAGRRGDGDAQDPFEMPAIAAFIAETLLFPSTCRQWALLFVVSGVLLALILVAIIALPVPRAAK